MAKQPSSPKRAQPVAILTGASSGIGYAVAEVMAASGYHIVIGSRSPQPAVKTLSAKATGKIVGVSGDLADAGTAQALVAAAEKLGGLDALLLNHGGPPVKPFLEITDQEWDHYFQLMVQGPLRLLRAAVPLFKEGGTGRVVAISSFTVKSPFAGIVLSNSLRASLLNALKTAALELGPDGILINAVAPGYIATARITEWNQDYASREGVQPEDIAARTTRNIPLRRYGKPEEVAELVAFLLSSKNGYITGQQILADGGLVVST